ncbi:MAG: hypothetical protein IPJ22_03865 [Bacteroidetes bacterium]|jgi:hypothetical protein|nr:hypothetical protein [Bacteroidota bacterium]MBL0080258.1 hypothetical protein [Bacteroidota bacterium]MBL0286034.1 hypothetical protein [Bacteroidota bacterium]
MKIWSRIAILLFILIGLNSCRKGPEDPFFSFITRKNRLANEWKAATYTINDLDQLLKIEKDTLFDEICGNQFLIDSVSLDYYFTIDKDGEYNTLKQYLGKKIATAPGSPCSDLEYTINIDSSSTKKGFWNFTGGVGNTANREQLFLYEEETGIGVLWDIIGLRTDELHLSRKYIKVGESTFTYEDLILIPKED